MSSLRSAEKQLLLEVARRALTLAAERSESLDNLPELPAPYEHGGAFVTLHHRGRLRGCIGQIESSQSLVQVIAHSAKAAALEDPRFDPVRADELAEIEIELSVLSPPVEIAPDRIEAGTQGLIVSRGGQRGVLLPQVASERHWASMRFLEETCVKAGLERDAWGKPETKIHGFTAEVFQESDFRSAGPSEQSARTKPRYSIST